MKQHQSTYSQTYIKEVVQLRSCVLNLKDSNTFLLIITVTNIQQHFLANKTLWTLANLTS